MVNLYKTIGHLHDGVILLLWQGSCRVLLSCDNYGFCYLNFNGATKFKYEKKTEKNSGRSSKATPSCKWAIRSMKVFYGLEKGRKARGDGTGLTVQNVRLSIASSWPSENAVKPFPLSQYSTTVTGCACYHGFSSSTTFGQRWRSCSDGCDRWVWPSAPHRGILATMVEKQSFTN